NLRGYFFGRFLALALDQFWRDGHHDTLGRIVGVRAGDTGALLGVRVIKPRPGQDGAAVQDQRAQRKRKQAARGRRLFTNHWIYLTCRLVLRSYFTAELATDGAPSMSRPCHAWCRGGYQAANG